MGGVGLVVSTVQQCGRVIGVLAAEAGLGGLGDSHHLTGDGVDAALAQLAQAGVALTRTLSATVQYSYYRYNFSEDTALAGDLPPEFSRNSVHVGLTLAMPLGRQASRAARP